MKRNVRFRCLRSVGSAFVVLVALTAIGCGSSGDTTNKTDGGSDSASDVRVSDSTPDVSKDVVVLDVRRDQQAQDVAEQDCCADVLPDQLDPDVLPDVADEAEGGGLPDIVDEPDVVEAEASVPCDPVDPTPGTTPGGYPLDGWNWKRLGIVAQTDPALPTKGFIAPAAAVVLDKLHLWYVDNTAVPVKLMHATSDDGTTFTPGVAATGLDKFTTVLYPSVIYDKGVFHLWIGGGFVYYATSADGTAWTLQEDPVLTPSNAGAFASLSIGYSNVIKRGDEYVMHYTGFDGAGYAIGRATSNDGVAWTANSEAVLQKQAGGFDNAAVAQPCAYATDSKLLLWYGGYDTSLSNPGPYRVGLAQTDDDSTYTRVGVTIDLEADGMEAYSTMSPAVVRWQDSWRMYYQVMGKDFRYRIAAASSTTCMP